jgi:hypothetical protein
MMWLPLFFRFDQELQPTVPVQVNLTAGSSALFSVENDPKPFSGKVRRSTPSNTLSYCISFLGD